MLEPEGLDKVFERHFRIAEGMREAVANLGLGLCAKEPRLYSDTVSAIVSRPLSTLRGSFSMPASQPDGLTAYAAGRRHIPVAVVMPRTAPEAKKEGSRSRLWGEESSNVSRAPSRQAVFTDVVAITVEPREDNIGRKRSRCALVGALALHSNSAARLRSLSSP